MKDVSPEAGISQIATESTLKSAEEFLAYRNERVIGRFMKIHKTSKEEAEQIFAELMKFLYICGHVPASSPPSAIVDEMWHTLIMFTWDYYEFCVNYVGRFLHHNPIDTPYAGNPPEVYQLLISTFGPVEDKYWYHFTKTEPGTPRNGDCDRNYCSENVGSDVSRLSLAEMDPYMRAGRVERV